VTAGSVERIRPSVAVRQDLLFDLSLLRANLGRSLVAGVRQLSFPAFRARRRGSNARIGW